MENLKSNMKESAKVENTDKQPAKIESETERMARFAKVWSTSRAFAGKTQEYMAEGLGVSRKTIRNWENGVTAPDLFMGSEWFRVLGVNPLPYYLSFLFPKLFDGISPNDKDELIEQALTALIADSTAKERREMLYIMAGKHGSPWTSMLQLFVAYSHLSLSSRVCIADLVLNSFEIETAQRRTVCNNNIQPDLAVLRSAIELGKKAVLNGDSGYTNVK